MLAFERTLKWHLVSYRIVQIGIENCFQLAKETKSVGRLQQLQLCRRQPVPPTLVVLDSFKMAIFCQFSF